MQLIIVMHKCELEGSADLDRLLALDYTALGARFAHILQRDRITKSLLSLSMEDTQKLINLLYFVRQNLYSLPIPNYLN
jgi:hypothetical protein